MKAKIRTGLRQNSPKNSVILNNRYEVVRLLGSGGFGDTYLARDKHLPSQSKCVIKMLRPTTTDGDLGRIIHKSFVSEARILERLGQECDRIPKLHAFFSENNQHFLVQQYVHGLTLDQVFTEIGVATEAQTKNILLQLLETLKFLHSNGMIHRDVKPENIILRHPDLTPILIDFGSVKEIMVSCGVGNGTIILGTPGYMALEQQQGMPEYASDIYSLGMTALFLLTGKHPLEIERGSNGILDWRKYNISPDMAEILQTATSGLSTRYESAQAMIHAINEQSQGQANTLAMKMSKPPEKAPSPLITIVLVLAVIVSLLGVFGQQKPSDSLNYVLILDIIVV